MNIASLLIALFFSVFAPSQLVFAADPPGVRALEIRVDDLAAAERFYCGFLQFQKSGRGDTPDEIVLLQNGVEIRLKRVAKRAAHLPSDSAHVNLNVMVADIEQFAALARKSSYNVLDTAPQPAQIGTYYRVLDPAGNMLHLIQPNFDFGDLSRPAVFNLGIQVNDMKRAREFYFGLLGFAPLTEKYYPPVVPIKSSGLEMILHEGSNKAAAKRSLDETGTSVVIEVSNFDAIAKQLQLKPSRSQSGGLQSLAFDPDGNLLVLTNSH